MRIFALIIALLTALPALAQDRMSAAEFDAYTKGKTLFYGRNGAAYGAEVYHGNRRVQWSFLDGECKEGHWYEEAGLICFVYEDTPDPQCWSFTKGARGLIARFENDPASTALYEAQDVGEELLCLGPKVGV
ncbi:hypothetical protein [Sulfitobacter aestuariivivens]|uniref:DUF995 domain-containing protein n=1 Tax=Sulfitobacter aestuariivivens TaxID=2766981 RepID=A0A927HED1_9RHOB|nr:hypothetical protein [Sulfitobacter aestuariivivens]MBD3663761.1 hypothetical protein [Sulfitobacter aestuariivivens]